MSKKQQKRSNEAAVASINLITALISLLVEILIFVDWLIN